MFKFHRYEIPLYGRSYEPSITPGNELADNLGRDFVSQVLTEIKVEGGQTSELKPPEFGYRSTLKKYNIWPYNENYDEKSDYIIVRDAKRADLAAHLIADSRDPRIKDILKVWREGKDKYLQLAALFVEALTLHKVIILNPERFLRNKFEQCLAVDHPIARELAGLYADVYYYKSDGPNYYDTFRLFAEFEGSYDLPEKFYPKWKISDAAKAAIERQRLEEAPEEDKQHIKLGESVMRMIEEFDHPDLKDLPEEYWTDCIRLYPDGPLDPPEDEVRTRLGGLPHLLPDIEWPTGKTPRVQPTSLTKVDEDAEWIEVPYFFYGQIRLSELPDFSKRHLLPEKGVISIFRRDLHGMNAKIIYQPVEPSESAGYTLKQAPSAIDQVEGELWDSASPLFDRELQSLKGAGYIIRSQSVTLMVEPDIMLPEIQEWDPDYDEEDASRRWQARNALFETGQVGNREGVRKILPAKQTPVKLPDRERFPNIPAYLYPMIKYKIRFQNEFPDDLPMMRDLYQRGEDLAEELSELPVFDPVPDEIYERFEAWVYDIPRSWQDVHTKLSIILKNCEKLKPTEQSASILAEAERLMLALEKVEPRPIEDKTVLSVMDEHFDGKAIQHYNLKYVVGDLSRLQERLSPDVPPPVTEALAFMRSHMADAAIHGVLNRDVHRLEDQWSQWRSDYSLDPTEDRRLAHNLSVSLVMEMPDVAEALLPDYWLQYGQQAASGIGLGHTLLGLPRHENVPYDPDDSYHFMDFFNQHPISNMLYSNADCDTLLSDKKSLENQDFSMIGAYTGYC
ncbi:MAG: hypothetical protein Alpg2KO_26410 [Alphaproteobacteria bacterium]